MLRRQTEFVLFWLACGACGSTAQTDQSAGLASAPPRPLYVDSARRFVDGKVPVCWENLDPSTATERGWVRTAVEETWQNVSAVRFSGWGACTAGSPGVHIGVKDTGPYTLGLGTDVDGKKDGMVLNFTFSTWSPGCQTTRAFCIRAGAVHEFGHALGFAHEQNRPDTPSWCTEEQGAPGDVTIGEWDLGSVMNYCNPHWTGDGRLSAVDIEGVRAAYGSGGDDWEVALSLGGGLAARQRGHDAKSAAADEILLADVSGDGRADLIFVYATTGDLWVAKARGGSGEGTFDSLSAWRRGAMARATRYLVADATGDGRADAIAFFGDSGSFWVAPSTGSAFSPYALWTSGHGAGSTTQLVADVTGDGKADAVAFFAATGNWWVAPSTGSAFSSYALWKSAHGARSTGQFLADVTGDGKADAVAFFDGSGSWWVSPSTGSAFSSYALWKSAHGIGSSTQLLADVTGDGRADAIAGFRARGSFWVAPSLGTAFDNYALWGTALGTALSPRLTLLLAADINGDGKDDALVRWLK